LAGGFQSLGRVRLPDLTHGFLVSFAEPGVIAPVLAHWILATKRLQRKRAGKKGQTYLAGTVEPAGGEFAEDGH
jgi:hypothetical protein